MEKKNFNKSVKMNLLCTDIYSSEHEFIHFMGEYAYATNGKALVRNKISEISNFTEDEIKLLDGKCLYSEDYKLILNYDKVDITADGFMCHERYSNVLCSFAENEIGRISKQFDGTISRAIDSKSIDIKTSGFNFDYIEKIKDALYHGKVCIIDCKENHCMIIKSMDSNASGVAVLMGILPPSTNT